MDTFTKMNSIDDIVQKLYNTTLQYKGLETNFQKEDFVNSCSDDLKRDRSLELNYGSFNNNHVGSLNSYVKDILLVANQAGVSVTEAKKGLAKNGFDIVNAIMELTM
jgi:hypothetical protein